MKKENLKKKSARLALSTTYLHEIISDTFPLSSAQPPLTQKSGFTELLILQGTELTFSTVQI